MPGTIAPKSMNEDHSSPHHVARDPDNTHLLETGREEPNLSSELSTLRAMGRREPDRVDFAAMCCIGKPRIGNMVVLNSYADGRPRIVVGPFWPVMACVTVPLIVGISIMVAAWSMSGMDSSWAGVFVTVLIILMICTVLSLFGVACSDPGLLVRHTEKPNGCESWTYSDQAATFRPRGAVYCHECDVVIEGYDHVCPWTGTGIGAKNMRFFTCFTTMVCILILYVVFVALFHLYVSNDID